MISILSQTPKRFIKWFGVNFLTGLETRYFFVAQLSPDPKDISFTKKFFPVEF
jgi:hypothetical protein